MDELTGGRCSGDSLPLLPDDLLVEIFLLLLPLEPIYLLRASSVSKHWRTLIHNTRFLRRFREIHGGTPPVLGFFTNQGGNFFVPTSSDCMLSTAANMSHADWWAYDCRHGRALLHSRRTWKLLVRDLVTSEDRYVPYPKQALRGSLRYNGAVLCAAGHACCQSCPFFVVLMFSSQVDFITSACVYSSETGVWGEITLIHVPDSFVKEKPTTLVGNSLYSLLDNDSIIGFDLDNHSLGLVEDVPHSYRRIIIMPTEDELLGLAGVDGSSLHLWSMVPSIDGAVSWTRRKVIDLEKFLDPEVLAVCIIPVAPVGYAEDASVIFIRVYPSIYMIHLKSMKIEEVSQKGVYLLVFPYASFYTLGE